MRRLFAALLAVTAVTFGSAGAEAKGCIKGAIVGGIAGHYAGHGLLGAAAGCLVGRRLATTPPRQTVPANRTVQPQPVR